MSSVVVFRRLAVVTAVFAYLQIALGSLVRVTGSGLGCPDWPLCHGRPYPPADIHSIIEYAHRTVGTITGVLVLATVLGAWAVFRTRRPLVAWLATASLVAYGAEGGLGALVVFGELPSWLVAVHLGMAMIIIGCLIATAVMSMPAAPGVVDAGFKRLAVVAAGATYLMLLTGSTVVASKADESCNSWPLCGGGFAFNFSGANAFTMLHRGTVLVVSLLLLHVLTKAVRRWSAVSGMSLIAIGTLVVLALQVMVGAASAITDGALANGLHVALATLLWSGVITTALLTAPRSDRVPAHAPLQVERSAV
jgi:heme A synthase